MNVLIISLILISASVYVFKDNVIYVYFFVEFFLISVLALIFIKRVYKTIRVVLLEDFLIFFLIFAALLSTFINFYTGYNSFFYILKTIGYIINLIALYYIIPYFLGINFIRIFMKIFPLIILPLNIIAILDSIHIINIGRIKWDLYGISFLSPSKSIFKDLNYFSIIPLVGTLSALYAYFLSKNSFLYIFLFIINFLGLLISTSRASLISLLVSLSILMLLRLKKIITHWLFYLLVCICTILVSIYFSYLIEDILLYRVFTINMGLTGREILWPLSIELIVNNPITGYGLHFQNLLQLYTNKWTSSHNTYLDFALNYGILSSLLLIILIFKNMYFTFKKAIKFRGLIYEFVFIMLLSLFLVSNSIVLTPGGAGLGSILFTLFLGYAKYINKLKRVIK